MFLKLVLHDQITQEEKGPYYSLFAPKVEKKTTTTRMHHTGSINTPSDEKQ